MKSVQSTRTRKSSPHDFAGIKQKQQITWASGDYAVIGTTLQIVGESLAEAVDVRAGERVLDVAAGNGNATLAAARRFADVTSTDYVPALLDKGAKRAAAEALEVKFQVADAEELPFDDESFDVVLSTFGAMFTPDHTRTAREMLRVVRSGGRIGLANWTPEGFIGQLFKIVGTYLPPPAGLKSPALWGTEPHIVALFGAQAVDIKAVRKIFNFRYRSSAHWLQVVPRLLRPDAQGVCGTRPRAAEVVRGRHRCAARSPECRWPAFARRAERIPRSRHHETLRSKE